jgi:hypothetical protein
VGLLLSAPGPRFGAIDRGRYRLVLPEQGPRYIGYTGRRDPETVWTVSQSVGQNLPTLIICRNATEVNKFAAYFERIDQEHLRFWIPVRAIDANELRRDSSDDERPSDAPDDFDVEGSAAEETPPPRRGRSPNTRARPRPESERWQPWRAFQEGRSNVCVTTASSVKGMHSVRRLHVVYLECPKARIYRGTFMQNLNILVFDTHARIKNLESATEGATPPFSFFGPPRG